MIFISIDDNEVAQPSRQLCNEVFGEENFVATVVWQKTVLRPRMTQGTSRHDHDYILVYARMRRQSGVASFCLEPRMQARATTTRTTIREAHGHPATIACVRN